jgi:hypothetical protein
MNTNMTPMIAHQANGKRVALLCTAAQRRREAIQIKLSRVGSCISPGWTGVERVRSAYGQRPQIKIAREIRRMMTPIVRRQPRVFIDGIIQHLLYKPFKPC